MLLDLCKLNYMKFKIDFLEKEHLASDLPTFFILFAVLLDGVVK
jgi:hypothetical protein